jgi:thiol-disulfide isomerase/thioredoxin
MIKLTFLISILLIGIVTACQPDHFTSSTKVIIAGRIVNDSSMNTIRVDNYLGEIAGDMEKMPSNDGSFKFILNIPQKLSINLSYKDFYQEIFIKSGDSLFLLIDQQKREIILTGKDDNTFNKELSLLNQSGIINREPYSEQLNKFKTLRPEQYYGYRLNEFKDEITRLQKNIIKNRYSDALESYYKTKLTIDLGYDLLNFLGMSSMFQKNTLKKDLPLRYFQTIDSIYYTCKEQYEHSSYHNFVNLYSAMNVKEEYYNELIEALKIKDRLKATRIDLNYESHRMIGYPKDYLITIHLISLIDGGYIDENTYKEYSSLVSIPYFSNYLKEKYAIYQQIQNMQIDSSKINLIDISDTDTISLFKLIKNTHKGRIVYADVWGTWCSSCINNFKYFPKLRNSLSADSIDYVFIAVNSPKQAWINTIRNHKLEGYHYLLNEKQSKELYKTIQLTGIPQYLLFDKKGNIVNSYAESPYNENALINSINQLH